MADIAEKRQKCQDLLNTLSSLLHLEVSANGVQGLKTNDLDLLESYYTSYIECLTFVKSALANPITDCPISEVFAPMEDMRGKMASYLPLGSLSSFLLLNKLFFSIEAACRIVDSWKKNDCDISVLSREICAENPLEEHEVTGEMLLYYLLEHPEASDKLEKAGIQETRLANALRSAEKALSLNALVALQESSDTIRAATEELKLALVSASVEHIGFDLLKSNLQPLSDTIEHFQFCETMAKGYLPLLESITAERIPGVCDVLLAAMEGEKNFRARASHLLAREAAPGGLLVEITEARKLFETVEDCVNERRREESMQIPRLALCSGPFIISYFTQGSVKDCWRAFLPELFPAWRELQFKNGFVFAIVDVNGETLPLPINGSDAISEKTLLSDAFRLLVRVQEHQVRRLTAEVLQLAHDINVGRVNFSVRAVLNYPSQFVLRFALRLWTVSAEGALFHKTARERGNGAERQVNASPVFPSKLRATTAGVRWLTAPSIGSPAAAAAAEGSRAASARKEGSKKTAVKEEVNYVDREKTLLQLCNSELHINLQEEVAASSAGTAHPTVCLTRSSICSRDNFSEILRNRLSECHEMALAPLSEIEKSRLRLLTAFIAHEVRLWEEELQYCASSSEYVWKRQPRLYVEADGSLGLNIGCSAVVVQHWFSSADFKFIVSYNYFAMWMLVLYAQETSGPFTFTGSDVLSTFRTLQCILGRGANVLWIDSKNPPKITACSDFNYILEDSAKEETTSNISIYNNFVIAKPHTIVVLTNGNEVEKSFPYLTSISTVLSMDSSDNKLPLNKGLIRQILAVEGAPNSDVLAEKVSEFLEFCSSVLQTCVCRTVIVKALTEAAEAIRHGTLGNAACLDALHHCILPTLKLLHVRPASAALRLYFGDLTTYCLYPQLTKVAAQVAASQEIYFDADVSQLVENICRYLGNRKCKVVFVRAEDGFDPYAVMQLALETSAILEPRNSRATLMEKQWRYTGEIGEESLKKALAFWSSDYIPESLLSDEKVSFCLLQLEPRMIARKYYSFIPEEARQILDTLVINYIDTLVRMVPTFGGGMSTATVVRSLMAFISGLISVVKPEARNFATINRIFWAAATYTCATERDSGWYSFLTSLNLETNVFADHNVEEVHDLTVNEEGQWVNFKDQFTGGEIYSIQRARWLAQLELKSEIVNKVCVVGPAAVITIAPLRARDMPVTFSSSLQEVAHDIPSIAVSEHLLDKDMDIFNEPVRAILQKVKGCAELQHLCTCSLFGQLLTALRTFETCEDPKVSVIFTIEFLKSHVPFDLWSLIAEFTSEDHTNVIIPTGSHKLSLAPQNEAVISGLNEQINGNATLCEIGLCTQTLIGLESCGGVVLISGSLCRLFSIPHNYLNYVAALMNMRVLPCTESTKQLTPDAINIFCITLDSLAHDNWETVISDIAEAVLSGIKIIVDTTRCARNELPPALLSVLTKSLWAVKLDDFPQNLSALAAVMGTSDCEMLLKTFSPLNDGRSHFPLRSEMSRCLLTQYEKVLKTFSSKGEHKVNKSAVALRALTVLDLALQGKSEVTPLEAEYQPPQDAIEKMICLEGTVNYTDYPKNTIRVMYLPVMDDKTGTVKDIQHVSIFVGLCRRDFVAVSAQSGGTCKGRIDKRLIITGPPFELRLNSVCSDSGEEADAGFSSQPEALSGDLLEDGKVIGSVELFISDFTPEMKWLRYGTAVPDEEVRAASTVNVPLWPAGETEGPPEDVRSKIVTDAVAACKEFINYFDDTLRSGFNFQKAAANYAFSVAALFVLAPLPCDTRITVAEELRSRYSEMKGECSVSDFLSIDSFSVCTGKTTAELTSWLKEQKTLKGLPGDSASQTVALLANAAELWGLQAVLYDPAGCYSQWANKTDSSVKLVSNLNGLESETFLIDASAGVLSISAILAEESISLTPDSASTGEEQEAEFEELANRLTAFSSDPQQLLTIISEERILDLSKKVGHTVRVQPQAAAALPSKKATGKKGTAAAASTASPEAGMHTRLASLVMGCFHILPKLNQEYFLPLDVIVQIAKTALRTGGGKASQDLSSVTIFLQDVLSRVASKDYLSVCTALSFELLVYEKRIEADTFVTVMRLFRQVNSDKVRAECAELVAAAKAAFSNWEETHSGAPAKGAKKEVKTLASFTSPKVMPSYPFMDEETWGNILVIDEVCPSLNICAALQPGEISKTQKKEDKWAEWLEGNCVGALPTYEKDSSVTPLDKLLVAIALRPDILTSTLEQFVTDTLGSNVQQLFPGPEQTARVLSATPDCVERRIAIDLSNSPSIEAVKHYILQLAEQRGVSMITIASVCRRDQFKNALSEAFEKCHWIIVEDFECISQEEADIVLEQCKPPQQYTGILFAVVSSPSYFFSLPHLGYIPPLSIRELAAANYARLPFSLDECGNPALHQIVFCTVILFSLIEFRSQINFAGLKKIERRLSPFRQCAKALLLARRSCLDRQIHWEELQWEMSVFIDALAGYSPEAALCRSYLLWLFNKDILTRVAEIDAGLKVPVSPSSETHFEALKKLPAEVNSTEMSGLRADFFTRERDAFGARAIAVLEDSAGAAIPSQREMIKITALMLNSVPKWCQDILADVFDGATRGTSALQFVLFEEIASLWRLSNRLSRDLCALAESPIGMSLLASNVYAQRTPEDWRDLAPWIALGSGCDSLCSWISKVQHWFEILQLWATDGVPGLLDFGAIRSPQAFSGSLLHDIAITLDIPKSSLNLRFVLRPPRKQKKRNLSPTIELAPLGVIGMRVDDNGCVVENCEAKAQPWWEKGRVELLGVFLEAEYFSLAPKLTSTTRIGRGHLSREHAMTSQPRKREQRTTEEQLSSLSLPVVQASLRSTKGFKVKIPVFRYLEEKKESVCEKVAETSFRSTEPEDIWKLRNSYLLTT